MSDTDAISAEAERLAKSDGYFSLMSMPAERRGLYTRAAKEVLAERERCASLADAAAEERTAFVRDPDTDDNERVEFEAQAVMARLLAKRIRNHRAGPVLERPGNLQASEVKQ